MAAIVIVAGLITYNYGWGTVGPSWAHRKIVIGSTERWATYKSFGNGFELRLPGAPIERPTTNNAGPEAISVVDSSWTPVLDRNTTTPNQLETAEAKRTATVAATLIASSSGPVTVGLDDVVATLVADVELSGARTSIVKDPDFGIQGDLLANFRGYPTADRSGVVHARAFQVGDKTLVVATFFERGVDLALQDFLIDNVRHT